MKARLVTSILLLLAIAVSVPAVADVNDWENPQVNSIGRNPSHTYALPLADVASALEADLEPSTPYVKSLNGDWKISWCGSPARRPLDFWRTDFDDSAWQTIDVPSCVELRGFGNPGYTNILYPHANQPPVIRDRQFGTPDYNPVSSYRTHFTVPASWKGRSVVIRFDGVYSAYYLWINGQKVGYAEDSKLPSEFDITKYLVDGDNLLAVEVYRWCDGSYLEDQDMFRFSGIFRDVTLIAEPVKPIRDFFVRTTLTNNYKTAQVALTVDSDVPAKARLYDAAGKVVATFAGAETTAVVRKPHLWSAEDPYLYTLVIEAGEDIRSARVGLKQVEMKGNTMYFNGKLLKFKGVNRHEVSILNGRTVSREEMLQDILLFKRYNINTVRTCHYPDHHIWYDLCDKYGIYVVAEANVEAHEPGYKENGLGQFQMWDKSIVERNARHVLNYRNHPSIFMWSLGNETGHGDCFVHAKEAVNKLDPTRPVHWERGNVIADVDSRMYPSVEWLFERGRLGDGLIDRVDNNRHQIACTEHTKNKAFFMCEYAHAMGNSMGNFQEYWDAFYSSNSLLGGCIWDWVDQTFPIRTGRYDADGNPVTIMAYGGDFDEQPNDGPFCCNGVIRPDRKPTAKLIEVAHVHRQIVLSSDNAASGKAKLWNRFSFTNANAFDATWTLLEDGQAVSSGSWTVPSVAPLAKVDVALPKIAYAPRQGKEYFLNVEFRLREDTSWAGKGHVIASDQLPYAPAGAASSCGDCASCGLCAKALASGEVKVVEDERSITVEAEGYKASFCRMSGTLHSLEIAGKQVLASSLRGAVPGPRLTCNRAWVDNDKWITRKDKPKKDFRSYGLTRLNYQAKGMKVVKEGNVVRVESFVDVTGSKSAGFEHMAVWTFRPNGVISVSSDVNPYGHQPAALPRLGLSWLLDSSLENVKWYGRGPWENYVDRKTGSFVGLYTSTVTDLYEEYTRPQDNGYRSDVRWVEFTDAAGKGVRICADFPMFVQALHYDCEDLQYVRHRAGEERRSGVLSPRCEVCLNIDLRQLGLGGSSCGPKPLDKYIFPIQKEKFTITLSAVK